MAKMANQRAKEKVKARAKARAKARGKAKAKAKVSLRPEPQVHPLLKAEVTNPNFASNTLKGNATKGKIALTATTTN